MVKKLKIFAIFVGGFFSAPSWIMYTYAFMMFRLNEIFQGSTELMVYSFFLLIVFPVSIVIALNQMKIIEDVDSRDKKKRLIVMSIFLVCMATLIGLSLFKGNYALAKFLLVIISPAVIGAIINKFWLLSVHTMSTASAVTVMSYFAGGTFYLAYLLVILVAWARVYEKKHTFSQVLAGGILGVCLSYLLLNMLFPQYS